MPAPTKAAAEMPKSPTEKAIAEIIQMNPRRVTVTLTLPVGGSASRPVVTLEWTREDTHMPLTELLKRIDTYVTEFASA
jgi:hypothetical protein